MRQVLSRTWTPIACYTVAATGTIFMRLAQKHQSCRDCILTGYYNSHVKYSAQQTDIIYRWETVVHSGTKVQRCGAGQAETLSPQQLLAGL